MAEKNLEEMREAVEAIREKMAAAAREAGRDPAEVQLCAACKTRTADTVAASAALAIDVFGENHVQELCANYDAGAYCGKPSHFIGHLQTNKVKYIVGKTSLIHSVDSLHLAKEIQKQAIKHDCSCDILVEVNIAGEASKFGTSRDEAISLVEEIAKLDHIHIKGLMTIAPFVDDPEDNRQYFSDIKQLSVDIAQKNIDNVSMNVLSMGMTGDYTVAIEEGATMVRVGTGIFGERDYSKAN